MVRDEDNFHGPSMSREERQKMMRHNFSIVYGENPKEDRIVNVTDENYSSVDGLFAEWYECAGCGNKFIASIPTVTRFKYCPCCGREVMWDLQEDKESGKSLFDIGTNKKSRKDLFDISAEECGME